MNNKSRTPYEKFVPPRIARASQLKAHSGNGKLNEDLGSDFASNRTRSSQPSRQHPNTIPSSTSRTRKIDHHDKKIKSPPLEIDVDDSIDDLDCLSQTSSRSRSSSAKLQPPPAAGHNTLNPPEDPRYPPPKNNDLSKLKFKKSKTANATPSSRKINPGMETNELCVTPAQTATTPKPSKQQSTSKSSTAPKVTTRGSKYSKTNAEDNDSSRLMTQEHYTGESGTNIVGSTRAHPKPTLAQFPSLSPIRHKQFSTLHKSGSSTPSSTSTDPSKSDRIIPKSSTGLYARESSNENSLSEEDVIEMPSPSSPTPHKVSHPMKQIRTNQAKSKSSNRSKQPRKIAPFPMPPQEFENVGGPSASASQHKSPDYRAFRQKHGRDTTPDSDCERYPAQFDDSLLFDVDPSKLCPYCDTSLPNKPTRTLRALLDSTYARSTPDPRPLNPLGLKAPLSTFIPVCQRHNFESNILPVARERGWPQDIDWSSVQKRIEAMRPWLRQLIENDGDTIEFSCSQEDAQDIRLESGKRDQSYFWQEIKKQIRKSGVRTVSSIRGQFSNFEKTQPGYYGEVGSLVIHQTLYNLFPPFSIDPKSVAPLTTTDFLQHVLVPEVALALIRSDCGLDQEEALKTLRDSVQYGTMMFPDLGDGSMSAGDAIVRERARLRKREVEEEDREAGHLSHDVETDSDTSMKSLLSNISNRRGQRTHHHPPVQPTYSAANSDQDTDVNEKHTDKRHPNNRAKFKSRQPLHDFSDLAENHEISPPRELSPMSLASDDFVDHDLNKTSVARSTKHQQSRRPRPRRVGGSQIQSKTSKRRDSDWLMKNPSSESE